MQHLSASTAVTHSIAFRHNVMRGHIGPDGADCVLLSCNGFGSQLSS